MQELQSGTGLVFVASTRAELQRPQLVNVRSYFL